MRIVGRRIAGASLLLAASACGLAPHADASGRTRLERAVAASEQAGCHRMHGVVTVGSAFVAGWDGVAVGGDEQYVVVSQGVRIEHRRIDGTDWYRRVEPTSGWQHSPAGPSTSLDVLLRGSVVGDVDGADPRVVVRVPAERHVLEVLGHVPSVGPAMVVVHVADGMISELDIRLGGGGRAQILLWDYGSRGLVVQPI